MLTRVDTNQQCWQFLQIPRKRKQGNAKNMLMLNGEVMADVTTANAGKPPYGCAMDNHGSHLMISKVYLGLLQKAQYMDVPFYKDFVYVIVKFPCYIYKIAFYKGHAMFCHKCAAHEQKNFVDKLRSGIRVVEISGVWCMAVCGVIGRVPATDRFCRCNAPSIRIIPNHYV